MNYYEIDGREFRAWGEVHCNTREEHPAHVWDSHVVLYGPYVCTGKAKDMPKIHIAPWLQAEFDRMEARRKRLENCTCDCHKDS